LINGPQGEGKQLKDGEKFKLINLIKLINYIVVKVNYITALCLELKIPEHTSRTKDLVANYQKHPIFQM